MDRGAADSRVEVEMRNMYGEPFPQDAHHDDDASPAQTQPGLEGMTIFNMPTLEPFEVDEDCQVSEMGGMTIFNMPRLVLDMDSVINHRYSEGLAGERGKKGTYDKLSSPKVTDSNRTSTDSEEPGAGLPDKEHYSRSLCSRVHDTVQHGLERVLEKIGLAVVRKPLLVLLITFLVSVALSLGTLRRSYESRPEQLWTPSSSQALSEQRYVTGLYGEKPRYAQFVLQPDPVHGTPGANMLTPYALNRLLELHQGAVQLQFRKDGGWVNYPSVCEGLGGGPVITNQIGDCAHASVLSIFGYDQTKWQDEGSILRIVNDPSMWSEFTPPGFALSQYLARVERDESGRITRANALMAEYLLHQDPAELFVGFKTHAMLWEDSFIDYIKTTSENLRKIDKYYLTLRATEGSITGEIRDGVDMDSSWVTLSLIALVCALCNMLWIFSNGVVGSRVALTFGALITFALAMASTFGLYCLCGFRISPATNTLPMMLGVLALNSVFNLVGAFDATNDLDIEDRVKSTMRTGGVSVTVSAAALATGFLVGLFSPLEGLRAVSFFCALGVLSHWALQITFFMACLAVDGERMANDKLDILCCLTRRHKSGCCIKEWSPPNDPYVVLFTRALSGAIQSRVMKLVVLVISGGLLALGIFGCIRMQTSSNPRDFLPKASYLNELYAGSTDDGYRTSLGTTVAVYLKGSDGQPISLMNPQLDTYIGAIGTNLATNPYIVPGSVINWVNDFSSYAVRHPINGTPASLDTLYTYLQAFLASFMGVYYRNDIILADTDDITKGLTGTCIRAAFKNSANDPRKLAAALDSVEGMLKGMPNDFGITLAVFAFNEPLVEQYQHIGHNAMLFMGLTIAVLTGACVLLLAHVFGGLLVGASTLAVALEVVGCLHFLGFKLDYVAFVLIFISIGALADYMIHIVYALLANYKAGVQDVVYTAMEECGSSILRGAIVILIAAILLAPAASHVFTLLFCVWMLIALLGFFQALAVIPVIFHITLPSSRA